MQGVVQFLAYVDHGLDKFLCPGQTGHGTKAALRPKCDGGGGAGNIGLFLYTFQESVDFRLGIPAHYAVSQHGVGIIGYAAVTTAAADLAGDQIHIIELFGQNLV